VLCGKLSDIRMANTLNRQRGQQIMDEIFHARLVA
jgi:hypothetical protein